MDVVGNSSHLSSGSCSSYGGDLSPLSPMATPPVTPQSKARTRERGSSTGKSKKGKGKAVYFWTSEDVNKWLRKHCMQYHQIYSSLFRQHDITGRCVLRMTDSKLQKMNIVDIQHREEIMRHIMRLKLKTEGQELKSLDQKALNLQKPVEKK